MQMTVRFIFRLTRFHQLLLRESKPAKILELGCHFKILFFSFKALNNLCNSFISDFKSLRSSSRNLLVIPRSKLKSYGDHAFSVSAPKLWNDIPETIKCSVDLNASKRNLKTYLFKRYFYE